MSHLLLVSEGNADPGAMGHDALIKIDLCGATRPVAGIRDAQMTDGIIYGEPIFRSEWRRVFEIACADQTPIRLEVSHHRFGERAGHFLVRSCENDELSLRQID